jgi:hypothetical protein
MNEAVLINFALRPCLETLGGEHRLATANERQLTRMDAIKATTGSEVVPISRSFAYSVIRG